MKNSFQEGFKAYLTMTMQEEIYTLLRLSDDLNYHSIYFEYQFKFINDLTSLSSALNSWPSLKLMNGNVFALISTIEQSLIEIQKSVCESEQNTMFRVKERILVRFKNIPSFRAFYRKSIGEINISHINNLILVKGTDNVFISKFYRIKSVDKVRSFTCNSCGCMYQAYSDSSQYHKLQLPMTCTNLVAKKPNPMALLFHKMNKVKGGYKSKQSQCGCRNFQPQEPSCYIDYQEIRIQDTFSTVMPGTMSRTIFVMIEGDLVNNCKVGDDVVVGGVLLRRWRNDNKGQKPEITLWIDCRYLELQGGQQVRPTKEHDVVQQQLSFYQICCEDDELGNELRHREDLLRSMCNSIFGQFQIKLGILLCMIGGVNYESEGTQIRGNSHLLMIGEPGTGKSTLLRFANQVSERSVYANGIGSTQAGLTVSYVREGNEWIIEAGALVLADQGVCCIDEFNLISKQQLQSILEALEQQTVSSSKAGLMARLNARVTLVAACNPVGPGQKYMAHADFEENSGLMSPLISRFDLIFVMTDEVSETCDRMSADHVLSQHMTRGQISEQGEAAYTKEQLKSFIGHVKRQFKPRMQADAEDLVRKYYLHLRKRSEQKVTLRKLESLVRLCQAHARMMCRETVSEFDAVSVVCLNEASGGRREGAVAMSVEEFLRAKAWCQEAM